MSAINNTIYKILVTHPEVPMEAITALRHTPTCEVILCQTVPPSREEIMEKGAGVYGLYWATHHKLDAEILNAIGPQLRAVSTMSAGVDNIDLAELRRRRIPLGHTPVVLNHAVADVAVGLMIAATRRFHEGRQKIDNGTWVDYHINWMWGQEIRDSTVGFFGFGGIGQTIAKRLEGFDVQRILYTTRNHISTDLETEFSAEKVPFNVLLSSSDFIFIAAPLTEQTRGVFNASAFSRMKNTAVLVNVARGPIIDHDDLFEALKTRKIFAAGLDVTVPEPLPSNHKLLTLRNLVISPHIGSATGRTRIDMAVVAAHNVLRGMAGQPMFSQYKN